MNIEDMKDSKVLIVDDNPTNLNILYNYLKSIGFTVLIAQDGNDALVRAERGQPDLILLDIMMPGIDGFETCSRLKNNYKTRDIPVIFMSALTETVNKVKGFELGAVDYITKPFQNKEVLARVSAHLSIQNLQRSIQEKNVHLQQEIRERARAEEALRESERRYRHIIEKASEAIYTTDSQGYINYFNLKTQKMTGYSEEELIGMHYLNLIPAEWKRRIKFSYFKQLRKLIRETTLEFPIVTSSGEERWVEQATTLLSEGNVVNGFQCIVRDITDRKRAEEALRKYTAELTKEKQKSDDLLLNILPARVAEELKNTNKVEPVYFESVSVMFTDFVGFTKVAEALTPKELVDELDRHFSFFDTIVEKYKLEKLKTIGDSYMCAGGIPIPNETHAVDIVLAALEILEFFRIQKEIKLRKNIPYFDMRIGINSGPLMAGVVGKKKFSYDIWGDAVNSASRMESSGVAGRINISRNSYELIKGKFDCEYRGKIIAKNKGKIEMYFVNGLKEK